MNSIFRGGRFSRNTSKSPKNKMAISPPTHNPRLIFGTGIDIVSIFYRTNNQVRRLCVGGDMAILCFGDFEVFGKSDRT